MTAPGERGFPDYEDSIFQMNNTSENVSLHWKLCNDEDSLELPQRLLRIISPKLQFSRATLPPNIVEYGHALGDILSVRQDVLVRFLRLFIVILKEKCHMHNAFPEIR